MHLGGACSRLGSFALNSAASAFWRLYSRSVLSMLLCAACACLCLALPACSTRQASAPALHRDDMLLYASAALEEDYILHVVS